MGYRAKYPYPTSCSRDTPRLGGVKMGLGLTGKLGHAWVGAWVVHGGGGVVWVGKQHN